MTDNTNIISYLTYGENIAKILLPDTSLIYLEEFKIKVSELVIENTIGKNEYFTNLDKKSQIKTVKQYGQAIEYISNPDKEVQLKVVK